MPTATPVAATMPTTAPPAQELYSARVEKLLQPPLDDVRAALDTALRANYREVDVAVADCPDLRKWRLCQEGLAGKNVLVDIGGEPFAHNPRYRAVRFDQHKIAEACGMPGCAAMGAGAVCSAAMDGGWGELTTARQLTPGGENTSWAARVEKGGACVGAPYESPLQGGLGNLLLSEGKPGKALRVRVKGRVGEEISFVRTLMKGLAGFAAPVGLGGTFRLLSGKVKAHVQPDLCCCPDGYYDCGAEKAVKPFLQFYDGATGMGPDLVCVTAMWSGDPTGGAMHLRGSGEHTHFFPMDPSRADQGGHYHGDCTPDEVEYEGYFCVAGEIARVRDAVAEAAADKAPPPTVCILGAGAMGCLFGGLLAEGGLKVTFVDTWKEHVDALNKTGLRLVGKGGDRTLPCEAVSDVAQLRRTFDVVVVQCKATHTRQAIESAKHLFGEHTVAVSFQNGLGNEDIIAEVLGGKHRVLGGLTLQGANMEQAGVARIHTDLVSYLGEWSGGSSERAGRLCHVFSRCHVPCFEETDIRKRIWMKLLYNCVVSPMSTLTNLALRDIFGRPDAMATAEQLLKEALAVARAEGVQISEAEGSECLDKVIASNQANKSSMCQDILHKRASEIDFINGRVVKLAESHGIDVPFNRAMSFFVKGLESHYVKPY